MPLPNYAILIARYQRSNFRASLLIVGTHMLIRRSLVRMDDDLVPFSRLVISGYLMQTHEALNIRVLLVPYARETGQESAINTCEILRSELSLCIKVCVFNVHKQESRPSAKSGLQSTK